MPVPNQSAICIGSVIDSSTYGTIRLRRLFLAPLDIIFDLKAEFNN
jgi:hypothetical protein